MMEFVTGVCTELLVKQLGLPGWMKSGEKENLLLQPIAFDLQRHVALVARPSGHDMYPDQFWCLFLDDVIHSVLRLVRPDGVKAWIRGESGHRSTEDLEQLLKEAFVVLESDPRGPARMVIHRV
jgi:hypothetical protein